MPTISEALTSAVQHHQAGQLQTAEQIYRQILAVDPNHADALHLLGVIAFQMNQHEIAVEYISRAIELKRTDAGFHSNLGNAFKAQGKLDQAVASFHRALELKPDLPEAHNNLGIAFQAQGKLDEAVASYRKALELDPDHAETHSNLGDAFNEQGKLNEAVACHRRAIDLKPDFAEAHCNLGNALQAQEKMDGAVAAYYRALELKPDYGVAHYNLGSAFQAEGKLDEAVASFRRALELNPDCAMAHNNLGTAFQAQGRSDEAVDSYGRALELKPDYAEAHSDLGNAFQAQGKLGEAIACCRRALELNPVFAEAHYNLGNAFQLQGELDEAVNAFRRAMELKPDYAEAYNNLGSAFIDQGKLDEAVDSCRRALELKPDYAEAHSNLGNAFRQLRRFDDAWTTYSRVLELKADFADAHFGYSLLQLLLADFQRGWTEYEWRWKTKQLVPREFPQPQWDGEPLGDRTILLHAEQGFGDTMQFVRYATFVKKLNSPATVIVECQRPLAKLLAGCPGIDRLIVEGDDLPPFDVHTPLLSLPGVFKTIVETIPAYVPYLFADPSLVTHWRERLKNVGGLRVGINWQGRPGQGEFRNRDIPLDHFAALAQTPGVRLLSLQKPTQQERRLDAVHHTWLVDPGDDVDTVHGAFMDTAAVMKNLDLVITSDTSIPHLAGALGVPVWLALPYVPDWRWLLDRTDSPWYPAMRLFRQKSPGDWPGVFQEIQTALRQLLTFS